MKSEARGWNKGVLVLSFSFAALSVLAVVAAYSWTTRSGVEESTASGEMGHARSTAVPTSSARGDAGWQTATLRPRPDIRLITTAVADDPTQSTATLRVDVREKTFVASPGDVVASDPDSDEARITDGGVQVTEADTILESVGPGWARFQRGDEQWTLEITDEAPLTKTNLDSLVAILGDSSLSPGEIGQRLLEAKRGLPIRENYVSEASFAPREDESGQMNGVYIRSVVPDGVFARMGLAGGDVLLAVNGIKLDTSEATEPALAAFESASSLRITRERHGEVQTVSVQRAPNHK